MPLPIPQPNQSKDDFLKSCMANPVMNKEFPEKDQRFSVCNNQWSKKKEGDTIELKRKVFSADLLLPIKKKGRPPKLRSTEDLYTAVAVVGDQFWNKGRTKEFCLASALEEGYKTMDGTFHNLDHASRIEDVIGTHIDTRYEKNNKIFD